MRHDTTIKHTFDLAWQEHHWRIHCTCGWVSPVQHRPEHAAEREAEHLELPDADTVGHAQR